MRWRDASLVAAARISFTHTEVDGSCEGRDFGNRLAAFAVDDVRRQGLYIVPLCRFIAHCIEKHLSTRTS